MLFRSPATDLNKANILAMKQTELIITLIVLIVLIVIWPDRLITSTISTISVIINSVCFIAKIFALFKSVAGFLGEGTHEGATNVVLKFESRSMRFTTLTGFKHTIDTSPKDDGSMHSRQAF